VTRSICACGWLLVNLDAQICFLVLTEAFQAVQLLLPVGHVCKIQREKASGVELVELVQPFSLVQLRHLTNMSMGPANLTCHVYGAVGATTTKYERLQDSAPQNSGFKLVSSCCEIFRVLLPFQLAVQASVWAGCLRRQRPVHRAHVQGFAWR
jgi:hypothetical protein